MRALLLAVGLLLAGCVAPAATDTPAIAQPNERPPKWSEAVRVFDLPDGGSFGILLVELGEDERLGESGGHGLAARLSGLGEGGYVSLFALVTSDAGWTLGGATASRGADGKFAITAAERAAFVFAAHAPQGATLEVTAWTHPGDAFDENFARPAAPGAWNASGPAIVSAYTDIGSDRTEVGVEVERVAASSPAPIVAGRIVVRTAHELEGPGFEVARATFGGLAGAGAVHAEWSDAQGASVKTFPAPSSPTPVRPYPGVTLLRASEGATAWTVEVSGATAGALHLEHLSVGADLDALGITLAEHFRSGIEGP